MSGFFHETTAGNYGTTFNNIKTVIQFFREHPDGKLQTGMWTDPVWNAQQFHRWFMHSLHAKINRDDTRSGRCFTVEYQTKLYNDARVINDYAKRIRWGGCGLLRTPEMKKRYPQVDSQMEVF